MEKLTTARLENRSTNNGEEASCLQGIFSKVFGAPLTGQCNHRQDIEKLQKEQEELHRNLGIWMNFPRLHRDNEDTKALRGLLEEEDMIDAALIKEKEHQQELDKEVNQTWFSIFCPKVPVNVSVPLMPADHRHADEDRKH